MRVYHEGNYIGNIISNHGLTAEEALTLLNIDVNEVDPSGCTMWDTDAVEFKEDTDD